MNKSFLHWLGLITSKNGTILILGLDNAGKTTLLSKLETGKTVSVAPTETANKATVKIGNATVSLIDLGGQVIRRRLWRDYFHEDISAIIFVVDAADEKRFLEAKQELQPLLIDDAIAHVPMLILGNKIDSSKAASEIHLREKLALQESFINQNKQRQLFMVSVTKNFNLDVALQWLSSVLK